MNNDHLREIAADLDIDKASHHIIFCAGGSCCDESKGLETWKHLKRKSKELAEAGIHFNRTKATCLRFCEDGPIAVVYPSGRWFSRVNTDVCDRLISAMTAGAPWPVDHEIVVNDLRGTNVRSPS